MTWTFALLAGSSLVGPPTLPSNEPEPAPVLLEWTAPAECPSGDEVERRLGELPGASASLQVWANIERREPGFVVTLRFADAAGAGERSFSAKECGLLTDAVVLVIAVALDPVSLAERIDARALEPTPEPTRPEPAPVEPATPVAHEDEPGPTIVDSTEPSTSTSLSFDEPVDPPVRTRVRVGARAFGSGAYGPTRTGYGGIGGAIALLGDRWRVEATAAWSIPRVIRLDDTIGGTFDAWMIGARACFAPTLGTVELPLCPGIEAGQVRGRGLDSLPISQRGRLPWVAPVLAQGLWWAPIEQLAIGAELALVVPLTRGSFVVEDREVDRLTALGVRGLVGVELRLP